jgi:hypothetical protein
MQMDFQQGCELILKAYEKREEEKAWQMWLTLYPNMKTRESFIPFKEFYKKQTQQISKRPAEEILAEAEEITERINNQKQKV